MLNPDAENHPYYPVTDKIRQAYPRETERWETLWSEVRDPLQRGCFTCRYYCPPVNEFVDVETVEGDELPWDTEAAFVNCALFGEAQMSLRTKCPWWETLEGKLK